MRNKPDDDEIFSIVYASEHIETESLGESFSEPKTDQICFNNDTTSTEPYHIAALPGSNVC